MQITVETLVKSRKVCLELSVDPEETILDIKKKIEHKSGVLYEHQNIFYKSLLLCDYLPIRDCGIQGNNVLRMECTYISAGAFRIFLKSADGIVTKVIVESFNTVFQVKEMVQKLEGTYTSDQRLIYDGNVLEERRTLGEYNIFQEVEIVLIHAY